MTNSRRVFMREQHWVTVKTATMWLLLLRVSHSAFTVRSSRECSLSCCLLFLRREMTRDDHGSGNVQMRVRRYSCVRSWLIRRSIGNTGCHGVRRWCRLVLSRCGTTHWWYLDGSSKQITGFARLTDLVLIHRWRWHDCSVDDLKQVVVRPVRSL